MAGNAPLRLRIDGPALTANWHTLDRLSGSAACGAAVKANGYGVGARETVARLAAAGCRDFFVATWAEAAELADLVTDLSLVVFHGVRASDLEQALAGPARPCLISRPQVERWRAAGGGACDVMVDTGMNRLGLSLADVTAGVLDDLEIDTLMSHLACADEPNHPKNREQRDALGALKGRTSALRMSLGNSAGIALGGDFGFDLTRPGLSLYGGAQVDTLADVIQPVVQPEAEVIQRRTIQPGETVGYNATFTAEQAIELAILNIGYADGYFRGFSGTGAVRHGDAVCPVIGRVSMDLIAVCVDASPGVSEGDFLAIEFDLRDAAARSGMGQYELLTGLGRRYDRMWSDA